MSSDSEFTGHACLMIFLTHAFKMSQCRPLHMASTGGNGIVNGLVF